MEIGCFISPHGYGHAARATAVLEALQQIVPDLQIHIFTTVPEHFFRQTLNRICYHSILVDIGLVQNSALSCNISGTIEKLSALIPYDETLIATLAAACANCRFIICDIAPMGIAVAQKLQIPSVLVENFTWDWIYAHYHAEFPPLARFSAMFHDLFGAADIHIKTEPLCQIGPCTLHSRPIFRQIRNDQKTAIRNYINSGTLPVVLITMGGVEEQLNLTAALKSRPDLFFVITGCKQNCRLADNIFELDRRTSIYHPNLIEISDLVVCKAGYSTIAECVQAGARAISVGRDDFAETPPLQEYLRRELGGIAISPPSFHSGEWLDFIDQLLAAPRPKKAGQNGAVEVANLLQKIFFRKNSC